MDNSWTISTPAAALPVALSDMKLFLRVDSSDEDDLITSLITAATATVQTCTNRQFVNASYTWNIDVLPVLDTGILYVPVNPLVSVTSFKYYDTDGDQQTWDSANYVVDTNSIKGRVYLASDISWPDTESRYDAVEIIFEAGYSADATSVPDEAIQAIKMLVGHWFENRQSVQTGPIAREIPQGVDFLISLLTIPTVN
jgi:uncharacterized phiE125 gp8 family phage protein